ncbi:outer membrane protein [Erythrobacter sp. THAF29]|uniref:outer membrane protein n=1 Tax=Erythrobacter sp. THAF29 TaxID=2587851 RepID=UPI001267E1D7|nr:P44/Msp2 family outer membrane protein [Erythrobacter sp. THAF29]QFT77163.1 Surface antigen [Erythrobacter sp. THAF29]
MKYKHKYSLTPIAIAALVAFPTAALADGPYVGVSGGVVLPEDSSNAGEFDADVPATPDFGAIPAGTEVGWETQFDTGFAISGQAGYAFENGFRLEAEVAYSEYDVDTHTGLTVGGANIDGADVAILTRGAADPANPTVGAVIADGQGKVTNFGLFGNVFYDINTGSAFKPYVGGGIGYQWVDVDYMPSGVAVGADEDGTFAYQLMAGASFEVSDNFEIFGQYTWRDSTEEAEIPLTLVPATLGVESSQSIISAGVRVGFGG